MNEVSNNKEIFEILSNAIVKIIDLDNNEIQFTKCEFKYVKSKYSQVYSYILYIDDIPCTGNKRKYTIYYKCTCGKINHCLLCKYMHKNQLSCHYCNQKSEFGNIGHNNPNYVTKNKKIQINNDFIKESREFQDNYYNSHLTTAEFYKWLPYIKRINDIDITNIKNIVYYPTIPCNNQMKYTSRVLIGGKNNTIYNISLQCSLCGRIFKVHTINLRNKKIDNIKCKQCGLVNKTYTKHRYKNTNLIYQSSIEKYFLDLCIDKNITVENGLKIPYIFNNGKHDYISDYYLPDYKIIIELKSKNIYYRMQLQNGKLQAKIKAAEDFALNNNMKYIFLFDNQIKDFVDNL